MNSFNDYEVWFVTGAQLLYGGDAVIAVDAHSNEMVKGLNDSGTLPVKVVYKGTVNSSAEISKVFSGSADYGVVYRGDHLDAYLFAGQDVDTRAAKLSQAVAASTYAVQQGDSLG